MNVSAATLSLVSLDAACAADQSESRDIKTSATPAPDTLRTRLARRLRGFVVARVQSVTEWNLWGDRLALDGYHSPDVMRSVGLSWWFSVDRSFEMDGDTVAQVVVMGESLCIYARPGFLARWTDAMAAGLRQSAPDANAAGVRRVASAVLRDAARGAAIAAREAGGSRFWRARPAGW